MRLTRDKILHMDLEIANKFLELKKGEVFKHKKFGSFLIIQNRPVDEHNPSLPNELVISRFGDLFRAFYDYGKFEKTVTEEVPQEGKDENLKIERAIFFLVEPQVQLDISYKAPEAIEDLYKPEEMATVLEDLMKGVAYITVTDSYHFANQVINRKNGTKVECIVVKHDAGGNRKQMEAEDIVMIEGILKVMEKIRILDYEITKIVKEGIVSVKIKIDIGPTKGSIDQKTLFDETKIQEPETVIISNLEEEIIDEPITEESDED